MRPRPCVCGRLPTSFTAACAMTFSSSCQAHLNERERNARDTPAFVGSTMRAEHGRLSGAAPISRKGGSSSRLRHDAQIRPRRAPAAWIFLFGVLVADRGNDNHILAIVP